MDNMNELYELISRSHMSMFLLKGLDPEIRSKQNELTCMVDMCSVYRKQGEILSLQKIHSEVLAKINETEKRVQSEHGISTNKKIESEIQGTEF